MLGRCVIKMRQWSWLLNALEAPFLNTKITKWDFRKTVQIQWDVVTYSCNVGTQDAEAGGSWERGHGYSSETLSKRCGGRTALDVVLLEQHINSCCMCRHEHLTPLHLREFSTRHPRSMWHRTSGCNAVTLFKQRAGFCNTSLVPKWSISSDWWVLSIY